MLTDKLKSRCDGRTDGGNLIDAARRCDGLLSIRKKQFSVRTMLAICDQIASRLLSIRNFSAAKIRRTNPHGLPR